jgi:Domain of unknown function (DUF6457)
MTNVLAEWVAELLDALGLDGPVDTDLVLDVARDAAHGVARPAAPVTTFLVGLAAGMQGGGSDAVRAAALRAQQLAVARDVDQVDGTSRSAPA